MSTSDQDDVLICLALSTTQKIFRGEKIGQYLHKEAGTSEFALLFV